MSIWLWFVNSLQDFTRSETTGLSCVISQSPLLSKMYFTSCSRMFESHFVGWCMCRVWHYKAIFAFILKVYILPLCLFTNQIWRGGPTGIFCDITNIWKPIVVPIFTYEKCAVETWSLQCSDSENGLHIDGGDIFKFVKRNNVGKFIQFSMFANSRG